MKILIKKVIKFLLISVIGTRQVEKLLTTLASAAEINLLMLSYQNIGILKYWSNAVSGENFVISKVLRKYLQKENLIVFDVGANVGNYSREIRAEFPKAVVHAFEPNPNTFKILKNNLTSSNINCHNLGASSKSSTQKIYTYAGSLSSSHASIYKSALLDLHQAKDVVEMDIDSISLDDFCQEHKINFIDFLKIDTEGHELEVLQGASRMISETKIGIIQFEFNEMNIVSRVFLKDFYEILQEYNLYRLDSNKLIPLFKYSSTNEIFKFQNFLAINKKLIILV